MSSKPTTNESSGEWIELRRTGGERGLTRRQRATLRGLGLAKNQKKRRVIDTNDNRGMVNRVIHWVEAKLVSGKNLPELKVKTEKGYRVV